jgi:hypothetical protein
MFAQNIYSLFEITAGFGEGLLAFHHARASAVAELFYESCCNFGHILGLLVNEEPPVVRRLIAVGSYFTFR